MVTFTILHQSYYVVGYDPVALWVNGFTDVSQGAWYYDAVAYANYYALFNGDGKGNFQPEETMSRAMFAAVIWNLEGKPTPNGTATFTDVLKGAWYYDAVSWAAENGIVSGIGNGKFAPEQPITREEMAVMLYNYATATGMDIPENRTIPDFTDATQIDAWAETAAKALAEAGVMNGDEGGFCPTDNATRAEVAALFKNFLRFVMGK